MSSANPGGRVEFQLLGPFGARIGDRSVDLAAPKKRALLALLVIHLNRVSSIDAITEALWERQPPPSAAATVQSLVSRLRGALSVGVEIRAREPGYVLEADAGQVDAEQFSRLAEAARVAGAAGDTGRALDGFTAALSLWHGPAFADLADRQFVRMEAARLDEARLAVTEDLAAAQLTLGRPGDAVELLETLLGAHPLRESGWGTLMLGYYRLGRQADALGAYRRLRTILNDEVGVEPNPDLRRLKQQILCQDAALDAAARTGSVPAAPRESLGGGYLPAGLSTFVGRRAELTELAELIPGTRLLTLTGIGGAGKTRLALEVATAARTGFPDGVRLAELASVSEPDLVITAVAAAVGLQLGERLSRADLAARLAEHLGERRLLLVLDNCEQVVGAAAGLTRELLRRCPRLTVLATSRAVLGVPGETVWPVPPLSLPPHAPSGPEELVDSDAVALFCERARAAHPAFELNTANAAAVSEICRRLDGVPLAVELASARLRVLSAAQIAKRLDDRFAVLNRGTATDARHQTLRAAMDWSYLLLPVEEQRALRRLAVFPASFDLDAAHAVIAPTGAGDLAVLDLVTNLVDKSLVSTDTRFGDARYRLLETVREYAADAPRDAGETAAARSAHRDHYLAMSRAAQARGEQRWMSTAWLSRAHAEEENFTAAVAFSLTMGDGEQALELVAGLWCAMLFDWRPEGPASLELVLAATPAAMNPARAEALFGFAGVLGAEPRGGRDLQRARVALDEADALAVEFGHPDLPARVLWLRATHALMVGDLDTAVAASADARRYFESAGDTDGAAWCGHTIGWAATARGDVAAARAAFEQALAGAPSSDFTAAHLLAALAPLVADSNDHYRAVEIAEEGVRRARLVPLRLVEAMALTCSARARLLLPGWPEVADHLSELLAILDDTGARSYVTDALEMVALVRADDHPAGAAQLLGAAAALRESCHEQPVGYQAGVAAQASAVVAERLGTVGTAAELAGGRALTVAAAVRQARRELAG